MTLPVSSSAGKLYRQQNFCAGNFCAGISLTDTKTALPVRFVPVRCFRCAGKTYWLPLCR